MRVLTVTSYFPNVADPTRTVFVKNLVQAMRARLPVTVVSPLPYAPPLRALPQWQRYRGVPLLETVDGIEVEHPRYLVMPKFDELSGLTYSLGITATLRRLVRERAPDVLHVHCAYPDAVGVALAARRLGLPLVVTAHGSDINVYARRRALRPQIAWALRAAAGVIAVSRDLMSKIEPLVTGSGTRLTHIPCAGFDPRVFFPASRRELRSALGIPAAGRIVVFVGQLVPIKGLEVLVEAWAMLAQRRRIDAGDRLVLIGDGRCRAALQQQARDAGIADAVRFLGSIPQEHVGRWLGAANLLCLPSRNEGTPNVVVEALASGIPVVASRVGGVPELVRDGENGCLVGPGDPAALADALAGALDRNWVAETMRSSVAHLTWSALAERNLEFLESVIGEAACASIA